MCVHISVVQLYNVNHQYAHTATNMKYKEKYMRLHVYATA